VSFGLLGDSEAMDDIDVVTGGLEESLRELVAAAEARRPPRRRREPARPSAPTPTPAE
jgi:hypothetical protein